MATCAMLYHMNNDTKATRFEVRKGRVLVRITRTREAAEQWADAARQVTEYPVTITTR